MPTMVQLHLLTQAHLLQPQLQAHLLLLQAHLLQAHSTIKRYFIDKEKNTSKEEFNFN